MKFGNGVLQYFVGNRIERKEKPDMRVLKQIYNRFLNWHTVTIFV